MQRKYVGVKEWMRASRGNKYHAKRTTFGGRTYDSKREAEVAQDYILQERAGILARLEFQPEYELLPKPNRIVYRADFRLTYPDGRVEVVDVKGVETEAFKLKQKMFRHFYPQETLTLVR